MNLTVPAVYENGVFRPVEPVQEIPEGTIVVITIQEMKRPENDAAKRSLTSEELHELIRSKNPHAEDIPDHLWEEVKRAHQIAMSNIRDPEVMRQAAERMDRLSEQIYKREGLLGIVVPYLREARDEE
jgi:predicted DNA-binding antitoxin AbrB/MazE fold protein